MFTVPVPDYFQEDSEDALRSRMQWLEAELGLDDSFFARLLRTDEEAFAQWKEQQADLSRRDLLALGDVWEMMMHVLSFMNFDTGRAQRFLEYTPSVAARGKTSNQTPSWAGASIKSHLETRGSVAVDEVNRWITSFRFGAPSLTPEQELPCP